MKISETPVDASGLATERVEIRRVTIRDTPPEPFVDETAGARRVSRRARDQRRADHDRVLHRQGARHRPPVHALAAAGVYDGMAFHRVAPGFVIQTGALRQPDGAADREATDACAPLPPEFNDTKHVKGIVSMARGDDPGQRDDVVLHLHRHVARARRPIHGVWPRRGRDAPLSRRSRRRRGTARHRCPHRTAGGADREALIKKRCEQQRPASAGRHSDGNRVTFTTTPTRYSSWIRSPGSSLCPAIASGPTRAACVCASGSSSARRRYPRTPARGC